jgi:bifunctional non-homologous end joining protein LigD
VTATLSHPDKVLFPDDGITKAELAHYYEEVAEWMLPHTRDRPLSLQVFPGGIGDKGFFQKNVPKHYPDSIHRVEVAKEGGRVVHPVVTDAETMRYLAGQNAITPHIWLSRADRVHQPDRMVVDLDPPPEAGFGDVRVDAAQAPARLRGREGVLERVRAAARGAPPG